MCPFFENGYLFIILETLHLTSVSPRISKSYSDKSSVPGTNWWSAVWTFNSDLFWASDQSENYMQITQWLLHNLFADCQKG